MRTFILIGAAALTFSSAAWAQDPFPTSTGDVERAFGMGWESFDTPINPHDTGNFNLELLQKSDQAKDLAAITIGVTRRV